MNIENRSRVNPSVDFTGRVRVINVETIHKMLTNHVQQTTWCNEWTSMTVGDGYGENEKKPRITHAKWKLKSDILSCFLKLS